MSEDTNEGQQLERNVLSSVLIGMGVGALVGAVLAVLFTPQSGAETREDLAKAAGRAKDRTEELVAEIKSKLDELGARSRELVDAAKSRLSAAVETGKQAAAEKREELSAIADQEASGEV